ncbi:hypothetical protein Tco_0604425 [Tanacetum coccineum]
MNPIATQQAALYNALVPPEKSLKTERCNARISFRKPQREETYQVTLKALIAYSHLLSAFLITAEVPEIYMHQFGTPSQRSEIQMHTVLKFVALPSEEELLSFIKELGAFLETIRTCRLRESRDKSVSSFHLKDKTILVETGINLHTIHDDSLLGTLKFVSKTEDSQKYGALIPDGMINQIIKDSKAYKTYYDFATGKITPKKARKFKKIASPSRKLSPVLEAEPVKKAKRVKRPAKKSTTAPTTGVVIRDTPGVFVSKKKAPAKADRGKGIELLSDAALLEDARLKKALSKSKQDTHKLQASGSGDGVSFQPKVPDEFEDKTTGTDEGTGTKLGVPDVPSYELDSDNESWGDSEDESNDIDDDDNANDDDNYDEEEHDEEYESDDDYEMCMKKRMMICIRMWTKFLILDNVPPVVDEVASMMNVKNRQEESCTQAPSLFTEKRKLYIDVVKKLVKDIIKDEVKSLLPQILPKEVSDFATLVIQSIIIESLENVVLAKSSSQPKSAYEAAASLTEFELKKILLDKIEKSRSYQAAPEHRELYDGLVKSYNLDKDLFSSYGNVYSLKRDRQDEDEDGRLQQDQNQCSSNDTKSQPKSGKFIQAEEPVLESQAPKCGAGADEALPIGLSAYVMHNLKIDNLTQKILFMPQDGQEGNALFGFQDLCLRQELLEYMGVHDNDASESSQPSWGKISKLEYKFQDKENLEDIFSFGSALEDFICVVFVHDRNIVSIRKGLLGPRGGSCGGKCERGGSMAGRGFVVLLGVKSVLKVELVLVEEKSKVVELTLGSNVTPTPILDEIIALSGETEIPKVMKIFFEQQIDEEKAFTKNIRDKIANVKASLTSRDREQE